MQNKQTLIDLGFVRNPDWDFHQDKHLGAKEFHVEHYSIENENGVFRAYENNWNGNPTYVQLGKVTKSNGIVDRWRDCQGENSILNHISKKLHL